MDKQPLIIEQRIRDMMQYGYIALRQFPKSEKHMRLAPTHGGCDAACSSNNRRQQ